MKRVIYFFLSIGVAVFAVLLQGADGANAQTCPHPACGAPGLPCCYGDVAVDEITRCVGD